jgi:hypothetical protein
MQVNFSVRGAYDNILRAIDQINDFSRYVSVTGVSVPNLDGGGEVEAAISMIVYMALKTEGDTNWTE